MASPPLSGSKPTHGPVVVAPTLVSNISVVSQVEVAKDVTEVNEVIESKEVPPQKMSLESYQARRKASRSPALAENMDAPVLSEPIVPNESKQEDVEMTEAQLEAVEAVVPPSNNTEPVVEIETSLTEAPPVIEAPPKVKLSLQEYQKQRQVASQRVTHPGSELPSVTNKANNTDSTDVSAVMEPF
ncbi:hypothetical protein BGZ52_000137, partial [Haplosporangium bisporale]